MNRVRSLSLIAVFSGLLTLPGVSFGQVVDPSLYSGLVWRCVGPFRGGRVAAVGGVQGDSSVFYAGYPVGGLWKSIDSGMTWVPIFDSIKSTSSIGSVMVAPSDPNIIYVGTGDMPTGGCINEGDGIYKSTDAGQTWTHLGLENTKQIPHILVDPANPDIVIVAAQGSIHQESPDRGIFRSEDGGKTWKRTLDLGPTIGIERIAWDQANPKVILATSDMHFYGGGQRPQRPAVGGPPDDRPTGVGLYISEDEGVTWKPIKSDTLPPLSGRTCVAIAPHTDDKRFFLVQNSGLWRSDDAGATWKKMDPEDRRVSNGQGGYNCGVYVNSANPDIVYVVNTCSYISKDGGNTFTGFKGAPGGDDPQQFWFDPTEPNKILLGSDQGATVSLNGGETWSSWYNQPTAQVYHISVDNRFPYWIYATQQDSGSIGTASRGNLGEITPLDWLPHPGYEFGSIVPDPLNPAITYAGGPTSGIIKTTYPSGQWIDVSPSIDSKEGLRHVGNQPLAFSPDNPHELMAGFQYLMASFDGGVHWKKLSPDLAAIPGEAPPASIRAGRPGAAPQAKPKPGAKPAVVQTQNHEFVSAQDPDGASQNSNVTQDGTYVDDDQIEAEQRGGFGGSIESFTVSTVTPSVMWAGTSNGIIQVTKDGGKSWSNVSIPKELIPAGSDISSIDSSHFNKSEAYVAIDHHVTGDYAPHLFRTTDFGKTWVAIDSGLPSDLVSGSFTRVIRADTNRDGLLFAGTESSVYVSFNDGADWQPLTLNLPTTSVRDMVIKGDDLVIGTYGRSFWILDDMKMLRQVKASSAAKEAILFEPTTAVRVRKNVNGDTPFPPEITHALNPVEGVAIDYYLNPSVSGPITLDITDSKGRLVKRMSSLPIDLPKEAPAPVPDFWLRVPRPMPTGAGMHRVNWDLRYADPQAFSHSYEINANPHDTPPSPQGPLVAPGVYTLALSVEGSTWTQQVQVVNDPRSPASPSGLRRQSDLQMAVYDGASKAWEGYQTVDKLKASVADILKGTPTKEVSAAADDLVTKLTAIGGAGGGGRFFGGFRRGGPPPAPSFATVDSTLIRQLTDLDSGDMAPNQPTLDACKASLAQLGEVQVRWKALQDKELAAFNALLTKNGLKPLIIP